MEEAKPRPLILVVGMKGTKDARAFLDAFEDLTRDIVTLPVVSERGVTRTAQDIATIADAVGFTSEAAVDIEDALRRIAARGAAPSRVLITGSLYLAGEVLAANGTPPT